MSKMIVIDLDGTLLNSNGEISQANRDSINKAKEKGAKIIIASGRMQRAIKSYALDVGADKYIVCGNGASIYDIETDEQIYQNYMPKDKVLKVIELCEKNSIFYSVYTETSIIAKSLKNNVLVYNTENATREENKKTNISIVEDIYDYIKNINTQNILKVNISDNNKTIYESTIRKIRAIPNVDILENPDTVRRKIKVRY